MATILGPDMLTVEEPPVFVIPSEPYSAGTGFEGYEFLKLLPLESEGYLLSNLFFHLHA